MTESDLDAVILGRSPIGVMLAAGLISRGFNCTLVATRTQPETSRKLVRRATLTRTGIGETVPWPAVESITRTRALEFETLDAVLRSERLSDLATRILVVEQQALVTAILDSSGINVVQAGKTRAVVEPDGAVGVQVAKDHILRSRLVIATGDSSAAAAHQVDTTDRFNADHFNLVSEAHWHKPRYQRASWQLIDGLPIESADATLSVLRAQFGTQATLAIPMQRSIDAGKEATDLLLECMKHPSVSSQVLDGPPSQLVNRVAPKSETQPITFSGGHLDLTSLSGDSSPWHLDRQLRTAFDVAGIIGDALHENDLTTTRFSRISRHITRCERENTQEQSVLGAASERWLSWNPDEFFESLFT